MNQWMDWMINEIGDRLYKLERQHVNNHGRVWIRPERREFNVRRVVRWVNTNMDKFMADNVDMSDVSFEDVSMRHWKCSRQQQSC